MNERIRELAEQAEFSEKDLHIQGDNFQMFAELIVRECANFVQFYYKDHACEGIAHDMKQHFGVES